MKPESLSLQRKVALTTLLIPGLSLLVGCLGSLLLLRLLPQEVRPLPWVLVWLLLVSAAGFVAAVLASLRLARQLSAPLEALNERMGAIARSGDLSLRVDATAEDELAALSASINLTLQSLEQKAAALRESEESLRLLLETIPGAIVVIDCARQHFVQANEQARSLFGYNEEELLRMGPLTLSPDLQPSGESSEPLVQARLAEAAQGRRIRFDWIHLNRAGERVHCDISLMRLPSRGTPLVCGILIEVGERRRAEERLAQSQQLLEEAQAMAHIGTWTLDPAPGRSEWSREMFRLHGLPEHSPVPDPETFFSLVHPDDRQLMREHMQRMRSHAAESRVEYRTNPLQGGTLRMIQATVAPICDEQGRILRLTGTCMDITRQQEETRRRRQLESQLIQAQKLDALGTLAGGIAHDFNNILSAILGNVDIAKAEDCDKETQAECLDGIHKAGRRARDLVQRILTFGRRQETSFEVLDLNELLVEVLQLLRSTLPANISLDYDERPGLAPIRGDTTQIHQVLMNLATNARQAMGRTGGQIRFELKEIRQPPGRDDSDNALPPGDYLELNVCDNGCGMEEGTLTRIFEPFFTTKPKGAGTGLGLSVVHGIMLAHQGAVRVNSTPGEGSCFQLLFPASQEPLPNKQELQLPRAPRAKGQHILFVDDEESLVRMATKLLTRHGYQVSGFSSPRQALEQFRASPDAYHLVVTDLSMPELSGLDLTRELHRLRPELPVILASGYLPEEEAANARLAGVKAILTKPNVVDLLLPILHQHLEGTGADFSNHSS